MTWRFLRGKTIDVLEWFYQSIEESYFFPFLFFLSLSFILSFFPLPLILRRKRREKETMKVLSEKKRSRLRFRALSIPLMVFRLMNRNNTRFLYGKRSSDVVGD